MQKLLPETSAQLAEALADAAASRHTINLGGAFSKCRYGGPVAPADVTLSTARLNRVLQYEPHDLTISVEAGMRFADLRALLAANRQMVPLDPPFADSATLGGILAANHSGPRRRLYGTARDLVIGMQFATLEGQLIHSGGMVVKNVAGLDMGKLLIGSFGTLAALAVVNCKLIPMPSEQRAFLLSFSSLADAIARRNTILTGVLQPAAVDLLSPSAARAIHRDGWLLALGAGGNHAMMQRYARELPDAVMLEGAEEANFWRDVIALPSSFLNDHPDGAIVRLSTTHSALESALSAISAPIVCRAANGVSYVCFEQSRTALAFLEDAARRGLHAVLDAGPPGRAGVLWPNPGSDFAIMERVKQLLDPNRLLNPGRLYGRL